MGLLKLIKTLCNLDINLDQDLFKQYSNYQRHLFYFISHFKEVQKKYSDYYDAFTRNMGNTEKRTVLGSNIFTSYESDQKLFPQKEVLSLFLSSSIGFYMKEDGESSTTPVIYDDFNNMAEEIYEIHEKLESEIIKALIP